MMYSDLSKACSPIYTKKRMQRSLSVAMFIVVGVLLSNSYDSSLVEVTSEKKLYYSTISSSGNISLSKTKTSKDPISRSLRSQSESERKENVLLVQTSTELKTVILNQHLISVNVPFSSWQASLRVLPNSDVDSVTMNRQSMRELNYTLGLGENLLDIGLNVRQLVGGNFTFINRHHIISIIRQSRWLDVSGTHGQVCYLEQDCDLILYNNSRCGPQPMADWKPSANIEGFWQMNCTQCTRDETCLWNQALWVETNRVTIPNLTTNIAPLRKCLQNYQLLFLGDSTNRGIMQSLMELTNKTLSYAAKTHGYISYNNVGLATNFSFTYYPAFWTKNQPTFAQTLHDLANNCSTVGKEEKTILVIGGVQWLTESQITELNNFTRRRGIPAMNVYIKTHSSGFHVNTSYTSIFHSQKSLQRLVKHNESLKRLALSYGFRVIDTLQMTHSRYKEFLQGACACHFHQVNKKSIEPHALKDSWIYSSLHQLGLTEKSSPVTQYHISGSIHNAYTNRLITEMCEADV